VIIDGKTFREAERHLEGFTGMEKLVNWKEKKNLIVAKMRAREIMLQAWVLEEHENST
jgi:hypothetical protein